MKLCMKALYCEKRSPDKMVLFPKPHILFRVSVIRKIRAVSTAEYSGNKFFFFERCENMFFSFSYSFTRQNACYSLILRLYTMHIPNANIDLLGLVV